MRKGYRAAQVSCLYPLIALVERILRDGVVVRVHGKWRAKLAAEDYDGSMKVMRRNSIFKAVGEPYRMDNVLCLRVKQVIQTLGSSR